MSDPAGKRVKNGLSLLLLTLVAGAGVVYFYVHWETIRALSVNRPLLLLIPAICFLVSVLLRGLFTLAVLRALGVTLSVSESFALAMVGTMANNLLPVQTAAGIRGYYLKRVHDLPIAYFASTMAAFYIFSTFIAALFGLVGLLCTTRADMPLRLDLLGLLLLLAGASMVCIFVSPSIPLAYQGRVATFLRRIGEGWHLISGSRSVLLVALLTSFGAPLFAAFGFYAGFRAFDVSVTFPGTLLLTSSYAVGGLVALTPGGIGFQEALGVYFGSVLHMEEVVLVSILLSLRLVRVITSILFGLPGLLRLRARTAR